MRVLIAATAVLQLTWLLEYSELTSGSLQRHVIRTLIKWLLLYWFLSLKKRQGFSWSDLGLGTQASKTYLRIAVLSLGIVLSAFLFAAAIPSLGNLVARFPLRPSSAGATLNFWTGVCVWSATAAFIEELIFRGYAAYVLVPRWGLTRTALISSALFGLCHTYASPILIGGTFAAGIGFWLLYAWRRNLILPIAVHFLLDVGGPVFRLLWRHYTF